MTSDIDASFENNHFVCVLNTQLELFFFQQYTVLARFWTVTAF